MLTKNIFNFPPLSELTFQRWKAIIFLLMLLQKWQMKSPWPGASQELRVTPRSQETPACVHLYTGLCGPIILPFCSPTYTNNSKEIPKVIKCFWRNQLTYIYFYSPTCYKFIFFEFIYIFYLFFLSFMFKLRDCCRLDTLESDAKTKTGE